MSVKTISKDELRRMEGSEGLILQGCGGNLDEWVDGINDIATTSIRKEDTPHEKISDHAAGRLLYAGGFFHARIGIGVSL